MKVSFIIASLDRSKELQKCLLSIENACAFSEDENVEALVVLQGAAKNESCPITLNKKFVFYHIEKCGLSLARNFAIERATGEYLVFLDDDASIKEDFLSVLRHSILTESAEALCGKILDPNESQVYAVCFCENTKRYLNRSDYSHFMGSAHVLKKSLIEKIGVYDERFGVGAKYPAAEDSDMFFRVKHHGEKVLYLPGLVFYHPINTVTSPVKCFNYSYAFGAMLSKQMFLDGKYFSLYAFIILKTLVKTAIRTMQTVFFFKSIQVKDARFQYRSVLLGTMAGAREYLKDRLFCQNL